MKKIFIWILLFVGLTANCQLPDTVLIGTPGSGAGDTIYNAFTKLNTNDQYLYNLIDTGKLSNDTLDDYYMKTETDSLLNLKASKDTLASYATVDTLSNYATVDTLSNYATVDTLANYQQYDERKVNAVTFFGSDLKVTSDSSNINYIPTDSIFNVQNLNVKDEFVYRDDTATIIPLTILSFNDLADSLDAAGLATNTALNDSISDLENRTQTYTDNAVASLDSTWDEVTVTDTLRTPLITTDVDSIILTKKITCLDVVEEKDYSVSLTRTLFENDTVNLAVNNQAYTIKGIPLRFNNNMAYTDSSITITRDGKYQVDFGVDARPTATPVLIWVVLYINDVEYDEMACARTIFDNRIIGWERTLDIDLKENDVLKLKVTANNVTPLFVMSYINFSAKRE